MSTHDRIGVEILRDAFSSKELSDIVANSHAWYTGNPHEPNLPTGENIPLAARVLTIADAYDAMTSDRVYRKARPRKRPSPSCVAVQESNSIRPWSNASSMLSGRIRSMPCIARFLGRWRWRWGFKPSELRLPGSRDFASLASMAGQLVATTRDECWESVTAIAAKLRDAAKNDPDMFTLVSLTTELMQSATHRRNRVWTPHNSPLFPHSL